MVVSLHSGIKVGCSAGRTFAHTQDPGAQAQDLSTQHSTGRGRKSSRPFSTPSTPEV